jgi:hypothetical protein
MNLQVIQGNRKTSFVTLFIYLSIFINSYVFFKEPFEFYFGYLIYIVLLPGFFARFRLNRELVIIFLVLFLTGIFNVFIGNNTPQLFFKVFLGLVLSYFFYYFVILQFKFDIEQLFFWYLKGSYIASIIGLVQLISFQVGFKPGYDFSWIFNKWGLAPGGFFGIRINSIFAEPTYLAAVLSAAFFAAIYNLFRNQTYGLSRFQSIVVILVYLVSFSGLGQMGIFLSLIFFAISYGLVI